MTNEIKETLNYVFSLAYGECFSDEREDIKKVENYITNLQEENERLKDYLKIMEKGKDNNLYRFINYKQRIDKALEKLDDDYILKNWLSIKELKNILRGDE